MVLHNALWTFYAGFTEVFGFTEVLLMVAFVAASGGFFLGLQWQPLGTCHRIH
jgi:hypothetical protein